MLRMRPSLITAKSVPLIGLSAPSGPSFARGPICPPGKRWLRRWQPISPASPGATEPALKVKRPPGDCRAAFLSVSKAAQARSEYSINSV